MTPKTKETLRSYVAVAGVFLGLGIVMGKMDERDGKPEVKPSAEAVVPEYELFPRRITSPVRPCSKQYIAQRSDPFKKWDLKCVKADFSKDQT